MSGVDNWSQAEKELYALGTRVLLDDMERQRRQWAESWAPDSTSMDEAMREHAAKMAQFEEDQRQWFARFIDGDEPAPTDVPAARGYSGASLPSPSGSSDVGHDLGQQELNQAELTADDIKAMSWSEYSALRNTTGIANGGGRGIFG